ncbi:MAG TPA: spore coat protein U domain-containing protein [Ramlibacter sp.]|uniref:spore coat protein U domain-containing protein n=1 Tax=Ramlibacter sp. TaxID=1917967 RepID=UPI002D7E880F|nr:spore coat protein U domain-containing protein [Ramlibacter sp.]HET8745745.1 spore coat protein U domain-containing protein [Ramlibacter sp.]
MMWSCEVRRRIPLFLAVLVACGSTAQAATGSGTLTVSATVVSKNECKFSTKSLVLDFQSINPVANTPKIATAVATITCHGNADPAVFYIDADKGKNQSTSGARQMRGVTATTEVLPYTLSWNPANGEVTKNLAFSVTFTGSVAPLDFKQVPPGSYSDTVQITVTP